MKKEIKKAFISSIYLRGGGDERGRAVALNTSGLTLELYLDERAYDADLDEDSLKDIKILKKIVRIINKHEKVKE